MIQQISSKITSSFTIYLFYLSMKLSFIIMVLPKFVILSVVCVMYVCLLNAYT